MEEKQGRPLGTKGFCGDQLSWMSLDVATMTSCCSFAPTVTFLGSQVEASWQSQAATGGFAAPDSALPTPW